MKDPYVVLGLSRNASVEEIKAAHRRLVKSSHPDLHPGDARAEAKFKAITAAYDLLRDPVQRRRFDAGKIDASGEEIAHSTTVRDHGADDSDAGMAEMQRQRRRGARGFSPFGSHPVAGQDLVFTLDVEFLDSVRGSKVKITLPDEGEVEVQIPKRAVDGLTLRLRGKGAQGLNGGPPGDALITLTVLPHPVFHREGDDILMALPITLDEAVLGAKVMVPTIEGPVSLTIPPGASSGRILRLRGRGVRRPRQEPGDQLVELRIVLPAQVDTDLRDFMEHWRDTRGYDHDVRLGLFGPEDDED